MSTSRITSAPRPPWAALPVVLAGIVMVVLDFFIVNVAMPALQADLGAGPAALEWIVAGYSLTAGVWLVSSGRLGDRYGRRRMYLLGMALFTVTSALCGLAPDAGTLVAARLAQGAAAALLTPQVLAIIGVAFTGPARAKAIAAYGLAMGVAAVSGQLVGGALVEWDVAGLGWRSCFLINVPVGLAALAAARLVPESRAPGRTGLDLTGTALAHRRPGGRPGAAHRGPRAGLARLDLGVPRRRGRPARGLRGPAAAAGRPRRRPPAGPRAAPVPRVRRGAWPPRRCSGAPPRRSSWSWRSTSRTAAAWTRSPRGSCSPSWRPPYMATSLVAPSLAERNPRRVVLTGAASLAAGNALLLLVVARDGGDAAIAALAPGLAAVGAGMGLLITPLVGAGAGRRGAALRGRRLGRALDGAERGQRDRRRRGRGRVLRPARRGPRPGVRGEPGRADRASQPRCCCRPPSSPARAGPERRPRRPWRRRASVAVMAASLPARRRPAAAGLAAAPEPEPDGGGAHGRRSRAATSASSRPAGRGRAGRWCCTSPSGWTCRSASATPCCWQRATRPSTGERGLDDAEMAAVRDALGRFLDAARAVPRAGRRPPLRHRDDQRRPGRAAGRGRRRGCSGRRPTRCGSRCTPTGWRRGS